MKRITSFTYIEILVVIILLLIALYCVSLFIGDIADSRNRFFMKNDKHIDEMIFVDDFYRSAYQYDYIEYRNSELMFWDRSYENNMSYILNNEYFIRKQEGWIDTLFLKGKIEKNICNDYFPTLVDTIRIKVLSENTEFEVEICKKYSYSDYFQWSALTTLTK